MASSKSDAILRPRMPELDMVRGLAILGVFLYHTLWALPNEPNWSRPVGALMTASWLGHFGVPGQKNFSDVIVKMIVVGAVSIGAAYLSRKYYEGPFTSIQGC